MKRKYCKYHPMAAALWWSDDFQNGYCERCVEHSESSAGAPTAKSLLTGDDLEYMGSAHSAMPFWERIPVLFKYPLQKESLLFLAVIMLVGGVMSSLGGLIALAGIFISLAAITKYGFMVIETTARGKFTPPPWGAAFTGDMNLFFKQLGVQLIFAAFLGVVAWAGIEALNIVTTLLVLLVMPASIMIFAMEEDIGTAVSPTFLLNFIGRIGGAYFILYLLLILFSMAHLGFFSLLWEEVPQAWLAPLFVSASLYFMMVMYHLMGYVIFQYQSELGFVSEDEKTAQRRMKAIDPYDAKVDVCLKEGRFQDAIRVLKKGLHHNPNDFKKHDSLSKLLVAVGDKETALEHADAYMAKLHKVGDDARLYFIYSFYQKVDDSYMPDDPGVKHVLAEQFYSRGKFELTIRLLANFHKSYPHYSDVAGAYLLVAEALFYGLKKADKSLQFLGFIKRHHSEFRHMEKVDQLIQEIKTAQ
ncbi:MAG: hypothetical protein MI976_10550 [Pseudomonadales bacterium]|nr:hypothetical protein [Pseudomonadales bacterium]